MDMADSRKPHLIVSCHADTGFRAHRLKSHGDAYHGHLDNFVGVHAVMNAYFSGRMDLPRVRIELTYGEEKDMEGAAEVLRTLSSDDVVVVVDVTGAATPHDITIEKCASPAMQKFVREALSGMSYGLYEGCPDPVSDMDESDIYRSRLENVFFLGIPCTGGDYNARRVSCRKACVDAASEALIRLARSFQKFNRHTGI